jgi:hypothetical protein
MFYSFGKLTKELEAKSEYLMPVSSEIKSIEVTKCNTLIALVLKNNNIAVFDLNTGEFGFK